jgi:transposase
MNARTTPAVRAEIAASAELFFRPPGSNRSGCDTQCLLADRGYDTNEIVEKAEEAGMQVVISPKKNRKVLRSYDKYLYQYRHLVENAFMHLERWRGIATSYAKNLASFVAAVQIRCIALWSEIL